MICHPRLKPTYGQAGHAQHDSNHDADKRRHHQMARRTVALEPFAQQALRPWVLQLLVQVGQSRAKVVIRNLLLRGVADRGRLEE